MSGDDGAQDYSGRYPGAWLPDPQGSGELRWWDGNNWTERYKPNGIESGSRQLLVTVAVLLAVVGAAMNFIPVSVNSGPAVIYIGTALVIASVLLAMRMNLGNVLVGCLAVVAILAVVNTVSVQHELNQREQQIQQELSP